MTKKIIASIVGLFCIVVAVYLLYWAAYIIISFIAVASVGILFAALLLASYFVGNFILKNTDHYDDKEKFIEFCKMQWRSLKNKFLNIINNIKNKF